MPKEDSLSIRHCWTATDSDRTHWMIGWFAVLDVEKQGLYGWICAWSKSCFGTKITFSTSSPDLAFISVTLSNRMWESGSGKLWLPTRTLVFIPSRCPNALWVASMDGKTREKENVWYLERPEHFVQEQSILQAHTFGLGSGYGHNDRSTVLSGRLGVDETRWCRVDKNERNGRSYSPAPLVDIIFRWHPARRASSCPACVLFFRRGSYLLRSWLS